MSYILEALKKSEMERRTGAVLGLPAAATYVVAQESPAGHRGAAILGAMAMLGAGLGLGAWHPWRETVPPEPVEVAAAAAPLPAVTAPTQLQAAQPQPEVTAPPPEAPPSTENLPLPAVLEQAPPEPPPKPKTVARPRPAPRAIPAAAAKAAVEAPRTAEAPKPGMGTVLYGELPDEVRGSLPPIVFGGYAGTGEDDRRIAFINRHLVKEGEEVSPGVRLEEVGPQGVVLGYRGYRFRPGP